MGLFDFFKSNENKKINIQLEKFYNEIFPDGKEQIIREVNAVREITQYKYTFDDVYKTWLYVSSIYHISNDKTQEKIVAKMLIEQDSKFTKDDAILTFKFLSEIRRLRNKNKIIINQSDASKIFMIALGGLVEIKRYNDLNEKGKFEVLIFNSIIILTEYAFNNREKYDLIIEEYFDLLHKKAESYKISYKGGELDNFINQRFVTFNKELNKFSENPKFFIPSITYNAFYENPSSKHLKHSENLIEIIEFNKHLINMIDWLCKNSKKILPN